MSKRLSEELRHLLEQQSGVFARWQVSGADLGIVRALLRGGRFQRLDCGIYAGFTGPPGRDAKLWAAVLRPGPGAALSYQTAAELDGFAVRPGTLIHVTVPLDKRMVRVPGLAVHRSGRIAAATHPARTPPRTRVEETVLDLVQASATYDDAFGWITRSCSRRLTTPALLMRAIGMRSRLRWRAEVMVALAEVADGELSPLERRYVRNVERPHGLPAAQRQVMIIRGSQRQFLDNLYKEFGIGVELDGQAYHPAEERWRDIRRDNALAADGLVVLRYGWGDVTVRACQSAIQLGTTAHARGWLGTLRPCGPKCPVASLPHDPGGF